MYTLKNTVTPALVALLLGSAVFFGTQSASAQSVFVDDPATPPAATQTQTEPVPAGTVRIQNGLCAGANLDITTNCQTGSIGEGATEKINELISDIINLFSLAVGVVSVFMIIIGGFKYITSGGESSNVSAAKNTILYAIIGLVIVALSQSIVQFILRRVISAA